MDGEDKMHDLMKSLTKMIPEKYLLESIQEGVKALLKDENDKDARGKFIVNLTKIR